MSNNKFWQMVELRPEDTVYETSVYLVVVTPRLWREQARAETDRNLQEYSIVNKLFGTVESGANNLPLAVTTAKALQEGYDTYVVEPAKGETNAEVVSLFPKNRSE